MKRMPTGVCWALLFNASMEMDALDARLAGAAIQEVQKHVESLDKHPDVDLFNEVG